MKMSRKNGDYFIGGNIIDGTDANLKFLRGYCGIGIVEPSNAINVGTLWRSALAFNIDFIFTIGGKYKIQKSDTCKTTNHKPLFRFRTEEEFFNIIPCNTDVCAVDNNRNFRIPKNINDFIHPERCVYLLGNEISGLSDSMIKRSNHYIYIPSGVCLNVSTAGSIILYDRFKTRIKL